MQKGSGGIGTILGLAHNLGLGANIEEYVFWLLWLMVAAIDFGDYNDVTPPHQHSSNIEGENPESELTEKVNIKLPPFTEDEKAQAIENAKVFKAILEVLGPDAAKKFNDDVVRSVREILQIRDSLKPPTDPAATQAILDPS